MMVRQLLRAWSFLFFFACLPTTHPWCFVVEFLARFFLEEGQREWVRRTMSQKADLLLDKVCTVRIVRATHVYA